MNRLAIVRIVSVLAGAAVLLGLQRGYGVAIYYALPAGLIVYVAVKIGLGLALGIDPRPAKRP
jgi:hypothetical protein